MADPNFVEPKFEHRTYGVGLEVSPEVARLIQDWADTENAKRDLVMRDAIWNGGKADGRS